MLLSAIAVIYLVMEMRIRTRELEALANTLSTADQQHANITSEMKSARRQYSEVIHQQFDQWQLTEGEQQASTIYGKSGVDGRHAFSAWFLEDLMIVRDPADCIAPE